MIDVVQTLAPPPPAILISIVLPVFLNVLPAPTKFNVDAFPIEVPPDDTPTGSPQVTVVEFPADLSTCPAVP